MAMTKGKTATVTQMAAVFDPATGEHIGDAAIPHLIPTGKKQAKQRTEPFVMVTTRSLRKLDMTGAQWQILMQLISAAERDTGESRRAVYELAEALGTQAPNVSRALRELQDRHIVFKIANGRYRVSGHILYRPGTSVEAVDPEPEWSRS